MNKYILLFTVLCLSLTVESRRLGSNFGGLSETPEVAAATQAHLEAHNRARQEALTRPRAPQYEEGEEFFFPSQTHAPVVPVQSRNNFVKKVPENPDFLHSTSSLDEPCHGPLCNLKYQEIGSYVVTEGPHHRSQQHNQVDSGFYRTNVNDLSEYRRQIPGRDYSQTLIQAAKAYSDIINGRN
ncbi:unnamed protein product [Brassicogethes aeneus]|uniref:Uncharacterized protein n=1 Tax=Brassicogethes aeneus TaxID=1431903 RepID=A0A9P0BDK0_BRAAE|nr:unnamed protein product [Brassicogethes aeneus]